MSNTKTGELSLDNFDGRTLERKRSAPLTLKSIATFGNEAGKYGT
jgi:hypothetical protein